MKMWNLDCCDDGGECDVKVFIPGPPGPPCVDVGTILLPVVITTSIAAPVNRLQRSFLSAAAPVNQPTIPNPSDNGPWRLELYVATGSQPITINNASNIKLSGQWIGNPDSVLNLEWDGNTRYVESSRNEI